jgi:hypothetical protein
MAGLSFIISGLVPRIIAIFKKYRQYEDDDNLLKEITILLVFQYHPNFFIALLVIRGFLDFVDKTGASYLNDVLLVLHDEKQRTTSEQPARL